MLFNSFDFVFFFIAVTVLYFILPHQLRWLLLLAASCYFYMFFVPIYIFILFFTILIDYAAGLLIEGTKNLRYRKGLLILSILSNVGVLIFFKYYNFLNDNIKELANFLHWNYTLENLAVILPVGLSFHTFQAMSYTIEVYRHKQKAERHLGIYALYVMFYPQLVAGPIERPQNLLHQFYERHHFDYERVSNGLKLILWGLFKKVVIADRLAIYVNAVYGNVYQHGSLSFLLATFFFAFQIYCDFSGYSDIALGSAKVMGFRLMNNFRKPYFSASISEFWSRWHISLSTWFKDYLYIPLGGNQVAATRWCFNLLVVFLVSGIWHGANWTFVVWGALHGFYLMASIATTQIRTKLSLFSPITQKSKFYRSIQIAFTFILVCFGWIYFRANNILEANFIMTNILTMNNQSLFIGEKKHIVYGFYGILVLIGVEYLQGDQHITQRLNQVRPFLRWSFYLIVIITIFLIGVSEGEQFIYFQF